MYSKTLLAYIYCNLITIDYGNNDILHVRPRPVILLKYTEDAKIRQIISPPYY